MANGFFEMGSVVKIKQYPGVKFTVIGPMTYGWILRVDKIDNSMVTDVKESDFVYISHSTPITMVELNNESMADESEEDVNFEEESFEDDEDENEDDEDE